MCPLYDSACEFFQCILRVTVNLSKQGAGAEPIAWLRLQQKKMAPALAEEKKTPLRHRNIVLQEDREQTPFI